MASKDTSKHQETTANDGGAFVLKSSLENILAGGDETGLAGEFLWPIHPRLLANLYRNVSEHSRAIHIKSQCAFGNGLIGERASEFDDICQNGALQLAQDLDMDIETYGNAFVQIITSPNDGRLIELRRLPAITMARFRGGFMQRIYNADGNQKITTFNADEILHLRAQCPLGKRYALPSWIGAQGMLDLAYSAIRFNASFFKNNAMPEYAVIFKGGAPTDKQKEAIKGFFTQEFQGLDKQHRTLVLNTGEDGEITFEKLTEDMKDADFLKLLDACRDRMPIAHGVPSRILGIMSAGQLGGGGEVSSQLFIFEKLTLAPKRRNMLGQLRPILKLLNLKPANDPDKIGNDEIAFKALDLTPPQSDTDSLPDLVNAGIVERDEARNALAFLELGDIAKSVSKAAPASKNDTAEDATIDRLTALIAQL